MEILFLAGILIVLSFFRIIVFSDNTKKCAVVDITLPIDLFRILQIGCSVIAAMIEFSVISVNTSINFLNHNVPYILIAFSFIFFVSSLVKNRG